MKPRLFVSVAILFSLILICSSLKAQPFASDNDSPNTKSTQPEQAAPDGLDILDTTDMTEEDIKVAELIKPILDSFNQGNKEQAIKDLTNLTQRYPENATIYYNLSVCYLLINKPYDALDAISQAIEYMPETANSYYQQGLIYTDIDKTTQAIKSFQKAIDIYPKNSSFYAGLGKVCFEERQIDKAIDAYLKAKELSPHTPSILYDLANCYNAKQQYITAIPPLPTGYQFKWIRPRLL